MTASPADSDLTDVSAPKDAPGDWLAVHVFYAASPRPLLVQCVRPLVDALTEEGLLAGYFFINYWLEGPHLRLRLKPTRAADAAVVRDRAHAAIAAFLRERPALYEVKAGFLADLYETLFTLEFGEEERADLLGPDGKMQLRPNNSFEDRPYEPEYGKYGGRAGIELAEWHFQHSSDLVIEAARSMNLHLRTVLLGLSAQLMMVMSGTFLAEDDALLNYLDRYHEFWNSSFTGTNYTEDTGYDRAYTEMGDSLPARFRHIRDAVAQGRAGQAARVPARLGRALRRTAGPGSRPGGARRADLPLLGRHPRHPPHRSRACAAHADVAIHAHDEQPTEHHHPRRGLPVLRARPRPARRRSGGPGMTTGTFLAARPRVHPDIVIGPALVRDAARIHLLMDPRSGQRMEVGSKEHFLISRLDGRRTLAEIGREYAGEFGVRLGEKQWGQLLGVLHGRSLLESSPAPAAPRPSAPAARPNGILAGRTRMVADAPALMDRLDQVLAPVRRPVPLTVLGVLAAAVCLLVVFQAGTLWRHTQETAHNPVLLFAVGCVLWCSLALHELAHGVVARVWGGRVSEIGLRWIAGASYLYCEVENVQFLGGRGRKVATACAGVLANVLFLVPFSVAWALLPNGAQARPPLGALIFLGVVLGVANLLPLPPLDGYKALGHAVGVTGLAAGTGTFLSRAARATVRRGDGIDAYPPRLRLLYSGFALVVAVQSAALLLLCGAGLRLVLPGSQEALAWWLPPVLLAAVVLLWALGKVGRARRARRAPQTTHAAAVPAGAPRHSPSRHAATPAGSPGRPAAHDVGTPHAPDTRGGPTHPPRKGEMTRSDSETVAADGGTESLTKTPTEKVIDVEGVTKRYGEVTALDGISLSVRRGEFFGVLGPNGAGKTTLVEIIGGLRQPDAGTVTVLGQPPWPRDTALLARIGVQTQASAFFARLTASEHLSTVAALYGIGPETVGAALARVGLVEKESARVDDLSGGQRQRLAIATALLHEPELIFFDEPTAALDPEARRELWELLRSLRSEGRTIVYTTHHLDEAEALCDRVAIVAGGQVAALDTPRNLIRSLAAPARLLLPAARLTAKDARELAGVDRAAVEGDELVIETTVPNRVLTLLGDLMDIEDVTVRTATLEDAYLTLTENRTEQDR